MQARIALVGTSTLLGEEIKTELGQRRDLWSELRLLTFDAENLGKVAELDGSATFVNTLTPESLDGIDIVLLPAEKAAGHDLISEFPSRATVLVVAPDYRLKGAVPLVDGVNLTGGKLPESALGSRLLVSPHPAAIVLSLLLRPLLPLGLERADGLLMLPSSMKGQAGLDELLEQSRRILSFQSNPPQEVFGHQLAFNLLPTAETPDILLGDVATVLGAAPRLSLHLTQASVFHGCTLALHLSFDSDLAAEAVREAMVGKPFLSFSEARHLGPIDSAGRDDIQISSLAADGSGSAGTFWLVAVFDNLTRGGAKNAVAIVEALARAAPA